MNDLKHQLYVQDQLLLMLREADNKILDWKQKTKIKEEIPEEVEIAILFKGFINRMKPELAFWLIEALLNRASLETILNDPEIMDYVTYTGAPHDSISHIT